MANIRQKIEGKNNESFSYKIFKDQIENIDKRHAKYTVKYSEAAEKLEKQLKDIEWTKIYNSHLANCRDKRAEYFIAKLFETYIEDPLILPNETLARFENQTGKSIKNLRCENLESELKKIVNMD